MRSFANGSAAQSTSSSPSVSAFPIVSRCPSAELLLLAAHFRLFAAPSNLLNRETPGWPLSTIIPGQRGPDCKLSRVGTAETVWLQRVLINDGRFSLVVFGGNAQSTLPSLQHLQSYLASDKSFTRRFPARKLFRFVSVIAGEGIGAEEYTGVAPSGVPYFDPLRAAHDTYGIDVTKGAIVVFRPDGYVATVVGLEEAHVLGDYFARFLVEGATGI